MKFKIANNLKEIQVHIRSIKSKLRLKNLNSIQVDEKCSTGKFIMTPGVDVFCYFYDYLGCKQAPGNRILRIFVEFIKFYLSFDLKSIHRHTNLKR